MPRGFWSGSIRLGLVNIPVSLSPAAETVGLDFDLVDRRDFAPVGYRKVNKRTGKEVPRDKIVKVFEVERGEAVVVTEEDFARARPKDSRALDLLGFLSPSDIPAAHFETPYFVEPAGKDAHAYGLLRDALREAKKAALAKGVLRTRERLGLLLADEDGLRFNTLRFPVEMRKRPDSELLKSADPPTRAELEMARKLVREMGIRWAPREYRDEYREQLLRYIRAKAKAGEARHVYEPEAAEGVPEGPSRVDLMRLLRESVKAPRRKARPAS